MAVMSPRALGWFIEAVLPTVVELTGLPPEEASVAAESLVPPFEQDDEGKIILRGGDGKVVGLVSMDDINPYDVLDDIEESGGAAEIEDVGNVEDLEDLEDLEPD